MYFVISEFQTVLRTQLMVGTYPMNTQNVTLLDIIKYNDYVCWARLQNCEK